MPATIAPEQQRLREADERARGLGARGCPRGTSRIGCNRLGAQDPAAPAVALARIAPIAVL